MFSIPGTFLLEKFTVIEVDREEVRPGDFIIRDPKNHKNILKLSKIVPIHETKQVFEEIEEINKLIRDGQLFRVTDVRIQRQVEEFKSDPIEYLGKIRNFQ